MFDISELNFSFFIIEQIIWEKIMENFEALSNDEIRDRLKKFGLPIIPVTNTTRKLMIKRLAEAASGGGAKANNKARRETVNVPKHSSADDSESDADVKRPTSKPKPAPTNRRATIAATQIVPQSPVVIEKSTKPKPIAVAEKAPTVVTPAKKSGRTTPSVPKAIVAEIREQSDDDAVVAPIAKPNRRTSRSPSLGKSSVVTTSYKHTIEPLHEQSVGNDDDDIILVNDEDSDPGVDEFFANKGKDSVKHFTSSTLQSTKTIGDSNVSRRTTLDTFRTTIAPGPTLLNEYREQANEAIATNESLFRRRYTTNTPIKPQRELNGSEDDENADPLEKVDTPFLSNFTRRLAQLKAEPLANLNNTFGFEEKSEPSAAAATSPTGYRQERDYYRPSYTGRSSLGRTQYARPARGVVEVPQEPSAWKKLEAKIRWPLFALLGLFLCVFIYVFLFTN